MKLLLVTDSYPPEIRSASHLMLELAEELRDRGHEITVITTWPEYNLDNDQEKRVFKQKEIENGITVLRVKTLPHHNVNYIVRGISQLLMPLQFLWVLFKNRIKPDSLVVYSPPLPLAFVGTWLRKFGVRYVLNAQDLFPQNAIDLGVMTNKWQIKFFRWIEKVAYRSAHHVTVHSEGNRKSVLAQYPEIADKLSILHNWVDIGHHDSSAAQVDFREKWGITHKHVAVFAGVMGPSQYLQLILTVAEHNPEVLFLLVGDGKEREGLEALAAEKKIANVRFEGFVSRDAYPDLLRICSIGLVCLSPQNMTPVVPGKILGYMAAKLPVAAFLQTASDGHQVIAESLCGVSANSGDVDACAKAMQALVAKADEFNAIGQSGYDYALQHFSKEVCIDQLEKVLTDR